MEKGVIIDLDRADAAACALLFAEPIPGVWGAKYRNFIHRSGYNSIAPLASRTRIFADLKLYDVEGSVADMIALYAQYGEYAPRFITISGDLPDYLLKVAMRRKGTMKTIVTTTLSDWTRGFCQNSRGKSRLSVAYTNAKKAMDAGADGITCHACLLCEPPMRRLIEEWRPIVIATGIRSSGSSNEHVDVRDIDYAFGRGATHAVVGREVVHDPHPVTKLRQLAAHALVAQAA